MARRTYFLLVALVLPALGCEVMHPSRPDPRDASAPVALLADGSAFDRPGVRQRVVDSLQRATRRRVLVLGGPASTEEAGVKSLAARLTKENPGLAHYDWREPHCAAQVDVLTAIERDVDAVYRISLDYRESTRPATDAELGARSVLASVLGALHLVAVRTVRVEEIAGGVALVAFAPTGSSRVTVAGSVAEVEPSAFTARLDVGAVVAEALAQLPVPPAPRWESVARRLVSAGCPFLALAVYETRLQPGGGAASQAVRKAALAAVETRLGKRTAAAREVATRIGDAIREGDLDAAASLLAEYEAQPARQAATVRRLRQELAVARGHAADGREDAAPEPTGEDHYSCDALCALHMVELCNNDKTLWAAHHAKWEGTACGARREEAFLQDCYRQQWLGGAYQAACMRPCESSVGGRDRLMRLLQGAGCLRFEAS